MEQKVYVVVDTYRSGRRGREEFSSYSQALELFETAKPHTSIIECRLYVVTGGLSELKAGWRRHEIERKVGR